MSTKTATNPATKNHVELSTDSGKDLKVAFATVASTSLEWYDLFIYSLAAATIMDTQYFGLIEDQNLATILSFATVGISFIFRPLGSMIAGHFGDKLGRKLMVQVTVFLMGTATFLVGVVPNYNSIGVAAPVLIVFLRILQGLAAGGMWGGAALMAVEHAPAEKRGMFGGFPQLGVPMGMFLAVIVYFGMTYLSDTMAANGATDFFETWGWRIPFFLSILIVLVGLWMRNGVEESETMKEIDEEDDQVRLPLVEMFKTSWKPLVQGALIFAGNGVAGYMIAGGFVLSLLTKPQEAGGEFGLNKSAVLLIIAFTSITWMATTMFAAWLSDKIGRKNVYIISFVAQAAWAIPMFMLFRSGGEQQNYLLVTVALIVLAFPIGFNYGPQSAMFAEMFPARIRYSGAALANAIGAVIGGGFAPMVAQYLVGVGKGKEMPNPEILVAYYIIVFTIIALIATLTVKDRTGAPLGIEADREANAEIDEVAEKTNAPQVHSDSGIGF